MNRIISNSFPAVVLLAPKDLPTWPWCRDGLLTNVRPQQVIVVCRRDMERSVLGPHVSFLDENAIVPGVDAGMFTEPRAGWYFQQILKLGLAAKLGSAYYLVVDSDIVFLRPVSFFSGDKPLYAAGAEYHRPYFDAYRELLGVEANREYSFIVHHMLFRSDRVAELLAAFRTKASWWEAIAQYIKPRPPFHSLCQFSEYETYGHFLKQKYPDDFKIRDLHWVNEHGSPSERVIGLLARRYDFAAFHDHMRTNIRPDHLVRSFFRFHLLPARKPAAL